MKKTYYLKGNTRMSYQQVLWGGKTIVSMGLVFMNWIRRLLGACVARSSRTQEQPVALDFLVSAHLCQPPRPQGFLSHTETVRTESIKRTNRLIESLPFQIVTIDVVLLIRSCMDSLPKNMTTFKPRLVPTTSPTKVQNLKREE